MPILLTKRQLLFFSTDFNAEGSPYPPAYVNLNPMKKLLAFSVYFGLLTLPLLGQFQKVQWAQTNPGGGDCFSVTPNQANIRGAVWSTTPVDLSQPQDWLMEVNLGTKDANGADGMAFVIQPYGSNVIGNGGGTLGFNGLAASVGVELDTWSNNATSFFNYSDPLADHMAIQRNGNLNHATPNNLAGPVNMIAGVDNLEDGQWHDLRITWDPTTFTLNVYFDCVLRLTHSEDFTNTTFFGNSMVYWGMTAATGGSYNQQQVCFGAPAPTFLTQTYTICEGDTIQPVLGLGTEYSWDANPDLSQLDIANPDMFPTTTTTFEVDYKDPCGFPVIETITVNVIPQPPVNLPLTDTLRLCAGEDSLLALPSLPPVPGLSILWHDNSTNFSYLINQPGLIWAEVSAGCTTVRDSMVVVYDSLPQVDFGPDVTLCEGDVLTLDANDKWAESYEWQDNSTANSFTVSQPGTYHVFIDGRCADVTDTITVAYDSLPRFELGADLELCENETQELNAFVEGATYLWQDNSTDTTFVVAAPGLIWAETTNGCGTWRDSVVAVYDSFPRIDLGPDLMLCEDDSVFLNLNAKHQTDWVWFDASVEPYYLIVQPDQIWAEVSNRCGVARDTMIATYDSLPRFELGPDLELCDDETILLDASSGADSYVWQDNSSDSTFLVEATGQYFATATNQCGVWTDTLFAAYDSIPVIELGQDQTLCEGEEVVVDANWPGANVLWTDGLTDPKRLLTTSGTYTVTASNRCGVATDSIRLEFLPLPSAELGPADTVICGNGPFTFDVTQSGATYLWQDGGDQSRITVAREGQYYVTVSRAGCSDSDTINVSVGVVPVVEIGDEQLLCDGASVSLDVSIPDPDAIYSWENGLDAPQRTISEAGTYTITVRNECGEVSDALQVQTANTPKVDLGDDDVICEGEIRQLDASFDHATYFWHDGSTLPSFTADTGGLYSVVVKTLCGTASDEVNFSEVPMPEVNLGQDTTVCEELGIILSVTEGQGTIEWQDGSSDSRYEVSEPGFYSVVVENVCGFAQDQVLIDMRQCDCELFIPTAFTPDGDAYNDEFYLVQGCSNLQAFQIRIFNRWGREVFSSDDPAQSWDGTIDGRPAATGVYAWVVEYVYAGGEGSRRDVKQGTVTLLR